MVLCTLNVLNIKFINCLVNGMQLMIFGEMGIIGELGIVGSEKRPTYKKKEAIIRTQRYQILESKIAWCMGITREIWSIKGCNYNMEITIQLSNTLKYKLNSTMHQSQHAIQVILKNIVSLDLLISITLSLFANQRYQKGRCVFSLKKARTSWMQPHCSQGLHLRIS